VTRDRCYDFLNIFAKKFSEKIGVLTQNKAKLCKILIITLFFFKKNANFFRQKLAKIAENCDHNIDPRLDEISPFWEKIQDWYTFGLDFHT
jgi:hypothetical protein